MDDSSPMPRRQKDAVAALEQQHMRLQQELFSAVAQTVQDEALCVGVGIGVILSVS